MRLLSLALILLLAPAARAADAWPDLSAPPPALGGGEKDAALIVGVENYAFVAKVPGARSNAQDWQAYLTGTLKVPAENVTLLRDNEATLEKMRKFAAKAAREVAPGGTLWFVFIGHGAPSKDGKDGLLVGADAQQDADGLYARSLPRGELLGLLSQGRQARTVALVDACFSGRSPSGEALVAGLQPLVLMAAPALPGSDRLVLMTAAKSDQFAGPLPAAASPRPAFSYLVLGALRGWASGPDGKVTAGGVVEYARKALGLAHDRTQTPELTAGRSDAPLPSGREPAPDLARIDREGGSAASGLFRVSAGELAPLDAPRAISGTPSGIDWSSVDVGALEKYNAAVVLDKGDAKPEDKAASWRRLMKEAPKFKDLAMKRASEWDDFIAKTKARETALAARTAARDADWFKLDRLLKLEVVSAADKAAWGRQFLKAYADTPGLAPIMAYRLLPYADEGLKASLKGPAEKGRWVDEVLGRAAKLKSLAICNGGRKDGLGCTPEERDGLWEKGWSVVEELGPWKTDADVKTAKLKALGDFWIPFEFSKEDKGPFLLSLSGTIIVFPKAPHVYFRDDGTPGKDRGRTVLVGRIKGPKTSDVAWSCSYIEGDKIFAPFSGLGGEAWQETVDYADNLQFRIGCEGKSEAARKPRLHYYQLLP